MIFLPLPNAKWPRDSILEGIVPLDGPDCISQFKFVASLYK